MKLLCDFRSPMTFVTRRAALAATVLTFAGCRDKASAIARNKADADRTVIGDVEFKAIHDVESRKQRGPEVLIVRDRMIGEDRCRLDDTSVENVHFINCRFVEHMMFGVELKNVQFTNCGFANVRWEGGKWSGLKFDDCGFIDNGIRMGTSEGIGVTTFEKCVFEGSDPPRGDNPDSMRLYGTFAGPGDSQYVDCAITRFAMHIDKSAKFVNCKINWILLKTQHDDGVQGLSFEDCVAGQQFEMDNLNIASVRFKNSTFKKVNARKLTATQVSLDRSNGFFDFFASDIGSLRAIDCTFNHAPNADDEPEGLGLSLSWIDAQSITLERCRFEGKYARLVVSGAEPRLFPNGKINYFLDETTGKPIDPYSKVKRLNLVKTLLIHGELKYCHVGEFNMEGAQLADTVMAHSQVGKLSLKNVQLSGKLDFSDTQIAEMTSSGITKSGLTVLTDKKSRVQLSA